MKRETNDRFMTRFSSHYFVPIYGADVKNGAFVSLSAYDFKTFHKIHYNISVVEFYLSLERHSAG